jgi:hypothetical protein
MTKRDFQAAEYAAEQRECFRRIGEWMRANVLVENREEMDRRVAESIRQSIDEHAAGWQKLITTAWRDGILDLEDIRRYERLSRSRLPFSVRIHAAMQRWCRFVWLKFLGR